MNQSAQTALDLHKTLQGLSDLSSELEVRRAECKKDLDKKHSALRTLSESGISRHTMLGKLFGGKKIAEFQQLNSEVSELALRIANITGQIERCSHDAEKAIDDYLAATNDQYRLESMRWKAVMVLKHSLELYRKETERALGIIHELRDDERAREERGVHVREWAEVIEHAFYIQALDIVKSSYEKFGSVVEDVRQHDKKVSCKITITYHGGSITFDIYEHPEHLSLYRIESLDEFIRQLEGLRDAIKTVLVHAENQYRLTIAERIKYHNRVRRSL